MSGTGNFAAIWYSKCQNSQKSVHYRILYGTVKNWARLIKKPCQQYPKYCQIGLEDTLLAHISQTKNSTGNMFSSAQLTLWYSTVHNSHQTNCVVELFFD